MGYLIIVSFRLPVSGCPRSYFRVGDLNFAWIVSSGIFLYHCRTKEDAMSLSSFSGGQHRLESAGKFTAILRDLFQLLWVEMNVIKARDNLRCRQEVACQIPGDWPVCPQPFKIRYTKIKGYKEAEENVYFPLFRKGSYKLVYSEPIALFVCLIFCWQCTFKATANDSSC